MATNIGTRAIKWRGRRAPQMSKNPSVVQTSEGFASSSHDQRPYGLFDPVVASLDPSLTLILWHG